MQTVLVTGATGFIASHLLPVLHQKKWLVSAAIRQNSENLSEVPIEYTSVGDIDGKTNWQKALAGIDVVIHLAARAHILQESTSDSKAEFLKVNIEGTANLVQQSIEAGVKHFIFISSIGAMATMSDRILSENSPCQPDTTYGRSKLSAEQALIDLAKNSSMTWTILRPTLVYGSGNPGNMERLIKLINLGLPLPFASIQNRRSFVYVENLVDAIAICMTHLAARNRIFLVSDGRDLSTPELIMLIANSMKQPCQLFPLSTKILKGLGRLGDRVEHLLHKSVPLNSYAVERLMGSLFVDIAQIQTSLHWQPPFSVEQAFEKTFQS